MTIFGSVLRGECMENILNIKETDLLIRFLAQEISAEETDIVQTWLNASQENKGYFEYLKFLWDDSSDRTELDQKFLMLQSWEKVQNSTNPKRSSGSNFRFIWRAAVAASILLLIGIGAYFLLNFNPEIKISSNRKIVKITLPDASVVWLNRNSELIYNKNYKKNRSLKFSGEGYFEVQPNASNPFVILTKRATITVLGTKFNVHAYPNDSVTEVVVKSGKVKLSQKLPGTGAKTEIVLTSGEKGVDNNKSLAPLKKPVDDPNYLSWKTREFVFNHTNIKEIVGIINNIYDANIELQADGTENCNLSGKFNCQSLSDILDMLQIVLNIKIENEGTRIIIKSNGC
jgi:ferric-dicitrate binding protein FerR (iron transport regulator)